MVVAHLSEFVVTDVVISVTHDGSYHSLRISSRAATILHLSLGYNTHIHLLILKRGYVTKSVVTCEVKLFRNDLEIFSVFYFTRNHHSWLQLK